MGLSIHWSVWTTGGSGGPGGSGSMAQLSHDAAAPGRLSAATACGRIAWVPAPDGLNGGTELIYRLRALPMAAAVLHVAAHPDDEDDGIVAYLARGLGIRTVFWSATRGEGGQNRIGPDRDEALCILRTWESLDARAVDGGEALYGPFIDFGFCKRG